MKKHNKIYLPALIIVSLLIVVGFAAFQLNGFSLQGNLRNITTPKAETLSLYTTFYVNSFLDLPDENLQDNQCSANFKNLSTPFPFKVCTLRAAIEQSNESPDENTIILPSGIHSIKGYLSIETPINIKGTDPVAEAEKFAKSGKSIISGQYNSNIFLVRKTGILKAENIVIQKGKNRLGAGIYNYGNTTLYRVEIRENYAWEKGAGIYNDGGNIDMISTIITDNTGLDGIGIYNDSGIIKITGYSSIKRNDNDSLNSIGAGIYNKGTIEARDIEITDNFGFIGGGLYNTGNINIDGAVFHHNGSNSGAAIYNSGNLTLSNATIALSNEFMGGPPGGNNGTIFVNTPNQKPKNQEVLLKNVTMLNDGINVENRGKLKIVNSIIAHEKYVDPTIISKNCKLTPESETISLGGNLTSDDTCDSFLNKPTDKKNISNFKFNRADISNNGSFLINYALIPGQNANDEAINAGVNQYCPPFDQRLMPRKDGKCDIGAYELQ